MDGKLGDRERTNCETVCMEENDKSCSAVGEQNWTNSMKTNNEW